MIHSINIENFQSHKNTRLTLSDGVNVIKGPSNSGKTAIIRALRWLILNRPTGFYFKNRDASDKDKTSIDVTVKDAVVLRTRNKGDNKYVIHIPNKENDAEFEALRGEVPSEIRDTLQLDERNLQTQFDGHFLLNDSAGEVAKRLNLATGLDIIDKLVSGINSYVRTTTREIRSTKEQNEQTKAHLTKYKFVDEVEPKVGVLQKLIQEMTEQEDDRIVVWGILEEAKGKLSDIDSNTSWLLVEEPYKMLMMVIDGEKGFKERYEKLKNLYDNITQTQKDIWKTKAIVMREDTITTPIALIKELEETHKKAIKLGRHIDTIQQAEIGMANLEMELAEKQKHFKEIFPDVCPLCEQIVRKQ